MLEQKPCPVQEGTGYVLREAPVGPLRLGMPGPFLDAWTRIDQLGRALTRGGSPPAGCRGCGPRGPILPARYGVCPAQP